MTRIECGNDDAREGFDVCGDCQERVDAIDLFAGPGGWDHAARELGMSVLGIELDRATCMTRRANGLPTIEGSTRNYRPSDFAASGLIGSPPCQTFSKLASGTGRKSIDVVTAAAQTMGRRERVTHALDERTSLVLEPLRWALEAIDDGAAYEWVLLEQVLQVAPVWDVFADVLRAEGYRVVTGTMYAEQYGTPQSRPRAVLLATRHGDARLPAPTHSRYHTRTPERLDEGVLSWVSMRRALSELHGRDWLPTAEQINDQSGTPYELSKTIDVPAQTVGGRLLIPFRGANANRFNGSTKSRNDGIKVSVDELAALQSFPRGVVWPVGNSDAAQQIGNAVPGSLASALLTAVTHPTREAQHV